MTDVWWNPNYVLSAPQHDYTSAAWGSYFSNPTILDDVLPYVNVMGLFADSVFTNTGNWMGNLAVCLARHGVGTSMAGGYITMPHPPSGAGNNSGITSAQQDLSWIAAYESHGGRMTHWTMDGFPVQMYTNGYTQAQAMTELVNYYTTFRASRTDIAIGIDVNFPQWPYGTYPGSGWPSEIDGAGLSDYSAALAAMISTLSSHSFPPFAHLQVDYPYDYALEWAGHNTSAKVPYDGIGKILALQSQVRAAGIPFGVMFNCERDGGPGLLMPSGQTYDPAFYYDVLNYHQTYLARGGILDQVNVISWYQGPLAMLPANQPFTHSNLLRDLVTGTSWKAPIWEFHDPGPTNFYYVDQPADKNRLQQSATFTLDDLAGPIAYLPNNGVLNGGQITHVPYAGSTPLYKANNGLSTIYTCSPSQIAFLQSLGGFTFVQTPLYVMTTPN